MFARDLETKSKVVDTITHFDAPRDHLVMALVVWQKQPLVVDAEVASALAF